MTAQKTRLSSAETARRIKFDPAGAVSATDVQEAIEELDTEKASTTHTHVLADVTDSGALAALDSVSATEIDANAVGSSEIADEAVTNAKLAHIATSRVKGRATAATGDVEDLTITQTLDMVGNTRGSVLYRGAAAWAILAPGTSGNVLTSNGAGADPSYQAAGGGGNSFETIDCPAGTDPVADSSTDTLTLTAGGTYFTITGNSTTDTIDFDITINGATDLAAPALDDELLIGDTSDSNNVKKADVESVVGLAPKLSDIVDFKSSGTWTKPSNLAFIRVKLWAGGGGGGSAVTDSGGSGGGYAEMVILDSALDATETVTLGAGGSTPSGAGGTTSFGGPTIFSATGGAADGGAAGTGVGGGGDIGIPGQVGETGSASVMQGPGGNAPYMTGAGLSANAVNAARANSGGGGSTQAAGGSGYMIIEEYTYG